MNEQTAWAAGLFEGEGSISMRAGRHAHSPRMIRLQLTTTDEDVARRFRDAVGEGSVCGPFGPYRGQNKAYWRWTADGPMGAHVLRALLPLLGVRRSARAEEVLACRPS